MSEPIAVLGGTFDPIHYGHLRLAWEVSEALHAQVRLIPCRIPAHRHAPIATPEQRCAMLTLALADQGRLIVDDRELRREGPSYAYDTLASLREEFGNERALIFVLGMDAFAGFASWHRWRDIFAIAHLCVVRRPGYRDALDPTMAKEWEKRLASSVSELLIRPGGGIASIEITPLDISASRIRMLIAEGQKPKYLVPEALLDFIEVQGLYKE